MELYNEDCLERLKKIPDKSIDLIFNDLPYGQTSCKWDSLIDIDELWKQYKRIRKDNTPIFFTCTTKFGHSLISSNMKEFRYDLIWVKSAACGFLNAKKMPMKKHEMIYVFYKKLPFYNLESHTHKFIKEDTTTIKTDLYSSKNKKDKRELKREPAGKYDPPLPVSVIKETENIKYDIKYDSDLYGDVLRDDRKNKKVYNPPLPVSVIKEPEMRPDYNTSNSEIYGNISRPDFKRKNNESMYNPPLPNSILEIKSQKGKHSTQKPDALMEWILKYYSKENDMVLDPTMGSGSMGVACLKMNRRFIGIEKDEEIFKVAQERIR